MIDTLKAVQFLDQVEFARGIQWHKERFEQKKQAEVLDQSAFVIAPFNRVAGRNPSVFWESSVANFGRLRRGLYNREKLGAWRPRHSEFLEHYLESGPRPWDERSTVRRVDFALDVFDDESSMVKEAVADGLGIFDLSKIREKGGKLEISRGGVPKGWTINCPNVMVPNGYGDAAHCVLVIYDKGAEQKDGRNWCRFEFRFRSRTGALDPVPGFSVSGVKKYSATEAVRYLEKSLSVWSREALSLLQMEHQFPALVSALDDWYEGEEPKWTL